VTRKRKFLEKQKEGKKNKKKMRQYGKMEIPQEAFIAALKVDVRDCDTAQALGDLWPRRRDWF
jgi:hypothetical protein